MTTLHNYMPEEYQKYKGVYHVNDQWYMTTKVSHWSLYLLQNAKVIEYDQCAQSPWIMIELGESVQYSGVTRLLSNVPLSEIKTYLKGLQS